MLMRPCIVSIALLIVTATSARSDIIGFSLELNSGGSPKFSIDNRSDPGWVIDLVEVDVRASLAVFDTTASDGIGTNPVDQALAFLPIGTYGSFSTAVTSAGLASYANAGNLALLATDINAAAGVDAGRLMTFNFSGFGPGDGWGFNVDFDKVGSNDGPRGGEMNGTKVTARFRNVNRPHWPAQNLTFTYTSISGNGRSFPAIVFATAVPEPTTGAIGLLAVVYWVSRRKRR